MVQLRLDIEPYVSVGPARFGMTEHEVVSVLGTPQHVVKGKAGGTHFHIGKVNAIFESNGLVEVTILPGVEAVLLGSDVFVSRGAFGRICRADGDPQETFGFIVFKRLGVFMAGFHDGDDAQKCIGAFAKGRWDCTESEMKALPQKYWT